MQSGKSDIENSLKIWPLTGEVRHSIKGQRKTVKGEGYRSKVNFV